MYYLVHNRPNTSTFVDQIVSYKKNWREYFITKDSILVPIYTVGYTNSILNQDRIKITTIKL